MRATCRPSISPAPTVWSVRKSPLGHRIIPPAPTCGREQATATYCLVVRSQLRPSCTTSSPSCSECGERTRHIASPDLVHLGHRGSIGKPANQLAHEQVFADVDVPRPVRRPRTEAAVSATAPIAGPAVHPVRVHTTPADTAPDEPGKQVAAGPAVPGLTGGTNSAARRRTPPRTPARDARASPRPPTPPPTSTGGSDLRSVARPVGADDQHAHFGVG